MHLKTMEFDQAIRRIKAFLKNYRPQRIALAEMVPAAVLIPILNKNAEAHVLFTLRTDHVEHHKGQVSFPGGAKEEPDADLQQTAVRETIEEIGQPDGQIEILGALDDFLTVTNFLVTPFVGILPYPYPYRLNRREVAEVLEVPLSFFLTDRHFEVKQWEYEGTTYPVYFYYYGETIIWGATAFMMNRFVEQVFHYNPAPQSVLQDPKNRQYLLENIYRRGKTD